MQIIAQTTLQFFQVSIETGGVITRVRLLYYPTRERTIDSNQFESTVIIPPASPDPDSSPNSIRAFWPGLMPGPGAEGSLLQNVVTNNGGGPHEWQLLPYYCCA